MNETSLLKAHLKICSKFPCNSSDPAQIELIHQLNEGDNQ